MTNQSSTNEDEAHVINDAAGVKERMDFNQDFKLDWHDPDEATDGYQLKWVGKDYARLQTGTAPTTVIIPDSEHNAQNKDSENIFLTGDNLEVLKHLQNAYRGAIKMIYIDPPYNTGSDGFVYSDRFEFKDEHLKDMLGLTDDEIKRLHTINGRSSHSAWLTFMYPRLRLARNLLTDDGVVFISIDDNEQANLKLLCDEIFGESNAVANFIWESKYTISNDTKWISGQHEHILCYAKMKNNFIVGKLDRTDKQNKSYTNPDNDINGAWKPTPLHAKSGTDKSKYEITFDNGVIWSCPAGRYPRYNKEHLLKLYKEGALYFNKNGGVDKKTYLSEVSKKGVVAGSILYYDKVGHTHGNNEELARLLGKGIFDNPKGTKLITRLLKIANLNKNSIIFDFFAGSGTTAHAVMHANKEDGSNRKWILCTLDEPCKEDSEARKEGYKTIDEIARRRIELAAKDLGDTSGFKHFYVTEPNIQTIDKIVEFDPTDKKLIADDMVAEFDSDKAKGEDIILTTWLTADGYKLTDKVQELDIAGFKTYHTDNSILYIISTGWGTEQTKELLNLVGERKINLNTIILYGYSFDMESMRELEINVKQSLNNLVEIRVRY